MKLHGFGRFRPNMKIGLILSIYKLATKKQLWEYIYHNTSSENQLMWRKSPSLEIRPMLYMHTSSHQKNWVRYHTKGEN
jgi:hypothetical protein